MAQPMDLTGQRFGRLTVVSEAGTKLSKNGQSIRLWKCKCECGNETIVNTAMLRNKGSRSCGCLQVDRAREVNTKHGMYDTRIYKTFSAMKERCNNPNCITYKNYGARGINVCEEWNSKDGFDNFYKWAMENGYSDDLSIDRIDVNGNYEPSNCRWADRFTQANNTRRNRYYTYNGETHSLSEWGRIKPNGLGYETLRSRLRGGWSVEDAFSQPYHTLEEDSEGHLITVNGETHNVEHWCRITGIHKCTFHRRVKRGWSEVKAATTPADKKRLRKDKR